METSTKKHLSVTVYYLLTGIVLGWPGLFVTGKLLPLWKVGAVPMPLSLAAIHLLVLGSMTTIAFGVLYQIVPIAFQAPPVPRHVLSWHLPLHVLSVITMVIGFYRSDFSLVGVGGIVLLFAAIAYLGFIGRSYRRARNSTHVHRGLLAPFTAFWMVVLVGLFQAWFPAQVTSPVLISHVMLGGFAVWGLLVLTFSYKLVPMFTISHGFRVSLPNAVIPYGTGIVCWMVAAWLPIGLPNRLLTAAGAIVLLYGLLRFSIDVVAIFRARKKRRVLWPIIDAYSATFLFVLSHVGVSIALVFRQPAWLYPSLYMLCFGGFIPLMYAYMQKMVPFLWFEYRFSKRPERKTAPLIDDMVDRRVAQSGMAIYFVGVILGLIALIGLSSSAISWISSICLTLGSMFVGVSLSRVLTIGGRRPADDAATSP